MKKYLLKSIQLLIVVLFPAVNSFSQWTQVAPVYAGAIANDGAISVSIGHKGYIIAGSSTSSVMQYDTLTNTWTPFGNVPATAGHAFAMSFVINDKAYIIGGDTGGVPLNTVWEFDPTTTTMWTQKNNFPGGVRDAGFAFSINNSGYLGGGFDGSYLYNDIWKYDQANDQWAQLPAGLPMTGILFPTSFVIGTKGYIVTGGTPPSGVNEITNMWCLDATNDSVYARANFAGTARQAALAFSNNNFGFVGGGQAGYMTNYNDLWMYDAVNDQWSPSPDSLPMLGAAWSSVFVIGNIAFAGLGAKFVGAGLTGTDDFYKFQMPAITGINNLNFEKGTLTVGPNPASDKIFIYGFENSASITIYDAVGRIMKVKVISENQNEILVDDLSPGVYNLQLLEKDKISSCTLIRK